jgi:hypothetical protein
MEIISKMVRRVANWRGRRTEMAKVPAAAAVRGDGLFMGIREGERAVRYSVMTAGALHER